MKLIAKCKLYFNEINANWTHEFLMYRFFMENKIKMIYVYIFVLLQPIYFYSDYILLYSNIIRKSTDFGYQKEKD